MKFISLNIIAKRLDIRPVRLIKKVEELKLTFKPESDVQSLLFRDACTLVYAYINSSRVSERTRNLARNFLSDIESEVDVVSVNMFKGSLENKRKPKTLRSKSSGITLKPGKQNTEEYSLILGLKSIIDFGIKAITSEQFKFIALMVSIGVQMQHSAAWFYRLSLGCEQASWTVAYGYAFMVDLFILVVTLEGKLSIAKTFAVLTFFANVLYFRFWVNFDYGVQAWTDAVSCLMVSGIIAYIIYAYTEIFVKFKE